jgi:YebC/PmpR family DNA-binding regulatory protein
MEVPMSGHSHAANVRHKKEANAAKRMKLHEKLIRALTAAVRAGGPEPATNAALAAVIERARAVNMPRDTIERAVKRAAGGGEAGELVEITFEAIGPGGVAILAECLTDNKNRTVAELRKIADRHGAHVSHVAWMFQKKGVILVPRSQIAEDDLLALALDAGAEDMQAHDEGYDVIAAPSDFERVKKALATRGIEPEVAEVMTIPKSRIEIGDPAALHKVLELVDMLEEHDDVQRVTTNANLPVAVGGGTG